MFILAEIEKEVGETGILGTQVTISTELKGDPAPFSVVFCYSVGNEFPRSGNKNADGHIYLTGLNRQDRATQLVPKGRPKYTAMGA